MIPVIINGTARDLDDGATIRTWLQQVNVDPRHVVAEVNGSVVPRERFDTHGLKAGDVVELIRFVGGG